MSSMEDVLVSILNYIGRLVCHQIPERTLLLGGYYLPVCARDTGIYLGFFVGYLLLSVRRKKARGPPHLLTMLFMVTPMVIDGGIQLIGFRTSTNELRLLTGLLFGTALSPFLLYLLLLVPLSQRLPILRTFLPKEVKLDDKDSWLSFKALSLGSLIDVASFLLINSVVGSINHLFYWLLSPLVIISIVLHIFLLPIFLIISLLAYLRTKKTSRLCIKEWSRIFYSK